MKSSFSKGDIVRTTDKAGRKIKNGKLNEPLVTNGTVTGNEHYGRIVVVKTELGDSVRTKPEYLEFM